MATYARDLVVRGTTLTAATNATYDLYDYDKESVTRYEYQMIRVARKSSWVKVSSGLIMPLEHLFNISTTEATPK